MSPLLLQAVGYAALALNLLSMTRKNVLHLRAFSLAGNAVYVGYGLLLHAPPMILGCSLAVGLHAYHLYRAFADKAATAAPAPSPNK